MKNLKEKFKKKINFVRPLYKKVNPNINITTQRGFTSVGNRDNLHGDDVKKSNAIKVFHKHSTERYNIVLPNTYERNIKAEFDRKNKHIVRNVGERRLSKTNAKMLGIVESSHRSNNPDLTHKVPDTWLRVYPAPLMPNESVCSVAFRCFLCQMGLSTFLCIWTLSWVLVIHNFEGPFEQKVSMDFKDSQNQLVIDLATELRQITPLSPKWRKAIEERIEAERQLTIAAVGRGARLHPGHFWDVAGTFLFSVYVLTALGFGAPVPQTLWGRLATLIYAIIAVPAHIYLMVHLSTCVVVNFHSCVRRLKLIRSDHPTFNVGRNLNYKTESPNCSRNSELKPNKCKLRKTLICILKVFCVGGGVPFAMVLYYILGLIAFGIVRNRKPLEVLMFPLEFTTTGGLEHVECYVRLIYGIYVEGAMILLSCALATIRRYSSNGMTNMAERYNLFTHEKDSD